MTYELEHSQACIHLHVGALYAGYRPRSIATEFNRNLPAYVPVVVDYTPEKHWEGTCWFGGGAYAFKQLLEAFGYNVIAIDKDGAARFRQDASKVVSKSYLSVLQPCLFIGLTCCQTEIIA